MAVVNKIRILGGVLEEQQIFEKVLRSLPRSSIIFSLPYWNHMIWTKCLYQNWWDPSSCMKIWWNQIVALDKVFQTQMSLKSKHEEKKYIIKTETTIQKIERMRRVRPTEKPLIQQLGCPVSYVKSSIMRWGIAILNARDVKYRITQRPNTGFKKKRMLNILRQKGKRKRSSYSLAAMRQ